MNRYRTPPHSTQSGAVLVVSLMMLVIMTLIGVTAMRSTILEEKMSANARDSMLALEASETVLLAGEQHLENTINSLVVAFDGVQLGLYEEGTNPDLLADATWVNAITYSDVYPGVTSQPKFIIELIGAVGGAANSTLYLSSYDSVDALGVAHAFRITARGTGRSDNAVVLLQSNYIRTF